MKQLLATLRFYVDNDTPNLSSAEEQTGPNEYEINIRPENDRKFSEMLNIPETREATQSIIAHELGHFIATVTHDPTHQPLYRVFNGPLAGETKAWDIAEKIVPIEKKVRKIALNSYKEND
jgi:hypothetical protein